jgi:hypothetical protein
MMVNVAENRNEEATRLRAREGWFDSVAFLISFSPGIPFPGSQIKSKSWVVFSSDEISLGFYLEQQWGQQNKMSSQ